MRTGTTMARNEALSARNRNAADEFYTQLTDIEAELRHYRDQFKGKSSSVTVTTRTSPTSSSTSP
jgi:hypothetical protein